MNLTFYAVEKSQLKLHIIVTYFYLKYFTEVKLSIKIFVQLKQDIFS